MLGSIPFRKAIKTLVFDVVLPLVLLAAAGAAFCWNRESVFFDRQVYFVDGDCYSRMTRVAMLADGQPGPIRRHDFENHPIGTSPHATAPMDYVILGLDEILRWFVPKSLPVSGALISPLLGLLTVAFLVVWSRVLALPFRWGMLALFALSPMTAQAFLLGRPDHQSLVLLLVTVALASEVAIWKGRRWWQFPAAIAWGLALWVSLFEPLILIAFLALARLVAVLSGAIPRKMLRPSWSSLAVLILVAGGGLLWDGLRTDAVDGHFFRWAANIGELRHAGWSALTSWNGWFIVLVPAGLAISLIRRWETALSGFCLGLVLLLLGLTLWHMRWGYFLVLAVAMASPWAVEFLRFSAAKFVAAFIAFWPIASAWDAQVFPSDADFRVRGEALVDQVLLREAALVLGDKDPGGVLAPWWFCPAIVWWSGMPCLGGTSHQSLPGTVDSSRFYLATDEASAQEILSRRQVRYVVAYEPDRVISNAAQILGESALSGTMAERLYNHPQSPPSFLRPVYRNRFFRVFEVVSSGSPGAE